MSGFGGAGAFSDGKYNITNDFGGTLYEHIGKKDALDLMRYVDEINVAWRTGHKNVFYSRNQIQKTLYAEQIKASGCFRTSSGNRH